MLYAIIGIFSLFLPILEYVNCKNSLAIVALGPLAIWSHPFNKDEIRHWLYSSNCVILQPSMELLFHCQFVKKDDNYCTYSGVRCESCSLVGFCCSWECFGYKNGYKQSCYGDGAQLPSLWIRRPSCYIRKHAEGDAVYEDAYYAYGYKLYGKGDMMTTLRSQLTQHLALIRLCDNMKRWKHAFFSTIINIVLL